MEVLTIVLSICGGTPPATPKEQMVVMGNVKTMMNVCTKNKIDIVPRVWPSVLSLCTPKANDMFGNCDVRKLKDEVQLFVPIDKERHIVYILPKEANCNFAGLGLMGPCRVGKLCEIWINGDYANYTSVHMHELGHNLGRKRISTFWL